MVGFVLWVALLPAVVEVVPSWAQVALHPVARELLLAKKGGGAFLAVCVAPGCPRVGGCL